METEGSCGEIVVIPGRGRPKGRPKLSWRNNLFCKAGLKVTIHGRISRVVNANLVIMRRKGDEDRG